MSSKTPTDELRVPEHHYMLNILWKRTKRQGRYYDKPISYTEFVEEIEKLITLAREQPNEH